MLDELYFFFAGQTKERKPWDPSKEWVDGTATSDNDCHHMLPLKCWSKHHFCIVDFETIAPTCDANIYWLESLYKALQNRFWLEPQTPRFLGLPCCKQTSFRPKVSDGGRIKLQVYLSRLA